MLATDLKPLDSGTPGVVRGCVREELRSLRAALQKAWVLADDPPQGWYCKRVEVHKHRRGSRYFLTVVFQRATLGESFGFTNAD